MNSETITTYITKEQKDYLEQLRLDALALNRCIERLFEEAQQCTREASDEAFTFDFIYNSVWTVEELLDKLNIKVLQC